MGICTSGQGPACVHSSPPHGYQELSHSWGGWATIDYQPTDRVAKRGLVVGVGAVHVSSDKGRCGNLGQKWIDVQLVLVQLRLHVCTLMHGHGGKQPSAVTPLWTKTIACLGLLVSDCMPHGENNQWCCQSPWFWTRSEVHVTSETQQSCITWYFLCGTLAKVTRYTYSRFHGVFQTQAPEVFPSQADIVIRP